VVTELLAPFPRELLLKLWATRPSGVFWRHDVDYDLGCAMKMAELERHHGVSSTYYFRVYAEEYGVRSQEFRQVSKAITRLGHKIGLHADLGLPRNAQVSEDEIKRKTDEQARYFTSSLIAWGFLPVKLSYHAPPNSMLWRRIDSYDYAMTPEWFGHYLADSRGIFREDPLEFLKGEDKLQINLHPEWWFLPEAEAVAMHAREMVKP
jgi:hypothetical protein